MVLDRQNYEIYGEMIFFIAFLFFLVRGALSVKSGDYKSAIMYFAVVIIYMVAELMKVLILSGVF